MDKLDFTKTLNFEKREIHTPELVFEKISHELKDATNGYIYGTTSKYDGFIESYSVRGALASLGSSLALGMEKDIQDELGEQGDRKFKNEFYISSPHVDGYRFRICFYEYGIAGYPVKLVLEQGIADEISATENGGYILNVNTEEELKIIINNILSTKRVVRIMQELIDASNVLGLQVEADSLIEDKKTE